MKAIDNKILWSVVLSANITSFMICSFANNFIGALLSIFGILISCFLIVVQKEK